MPTMIAIVISSGVYIILRPFAYVYHLPHCRLLFNPVHYIRTIPTQSHQFKGPHHPKIKQNDIVLSGVSNDVFVAIDSHKRAATTSRHYPQHPLRNLGPFQQRTSMA
jgi:hypothetical protein